MAAAFPFTALIDTSPCTCKGGGRGEGDGAKGALHQVSSSLLEGWLEEVNNTPYCNKSAYGACNSTVDGEHWTSDAGLPASATQVPGIAHVREEPCLAWLRGAERCAWPTALLPMQLVAGVGVTPVDTAMKEVRQANTPPLTTAIRTDETPVGDGLNPWRGTEKAVATCQRSLDHLK